MQNNTAQYSNKMTLNETGRKIIQNCSEKKRSPKWWPVNSWSLFSLKGRSSVLYSYNSVEKFVASSSQNYSRRGQAERYPLASVIQELHTGEASGKHYGQQVSFASFRDFPKHQVTRRQSTLQNGHSSCSLNIPSALSVSINFLVFFFFPFFFFLSNHHPWHSHRVSSRCSPPQPSATI